MKKLTIGYSPCPNDTFIFYALVHNKVPLNGICFAPPVLDDVETLNLWALQQKLDVTKLSFHALGHVLDNYVMLTAGAALGRGCGPLLVTGQGHVLDPVRDRIAVPGKYTTAAMLLKLYEPRCENIQVMRFDRIMPALEDGTVEGGVIIHESRFTYQDFGLRCVQDLGEWWEGETGLPIPLGCIAARKNLPAVKLREIDSAIRKSLEWARNNSGQCMHYIRKHAQEMSSDVLRSHIDLYVNDFSLHIGDEGKSAVRELLRRGMDAGVFPKNSDIGWSLNT
ncbi:MAG: 1,4-dihydroxy-6-naphthoate synthase [Desulfobulbaceae bacterium]|nr:1,4-dihydroxy-6-naphthoate synthase [Desulfobulbaceae bacterium]